MCDMALSLAFAISSPCVALRSSSFRPPALSPRPRCASASPATQQPFQRTRRRVSTTMKQGAETALDIGQLEAEVETYLDTGTAALREAKDLRELDAVRVKYMGKKGSITGVMKSVGKLEKADRPKLGAVVNSAKEKFNELLAERKEQLVAEKEAKRYDDDEDIDVTLPGLRMRPRVGRIHPLRSTMDRAVDIFVRLGYDLIDEMSPYNREIEEDWHCFEALGCPPDHPARDMQDTFYMDESKKMLLRTQTSAMQIRYMMDPANKPPYAIIAPGRVYRRDAVDATHSPVFHQIEILHIRERGELNVGSLRATVIHFLEEMFGEQIKTRFRGSYFPFTEPSMEVDVSFGGKWLEVLGCGMVDPLVLENVGLDPEKYVGFAAGFGVERFAMVIHGIKDIREFYRSDKRFLTQFNIESHNLDEIPREN